MFKKTVVTALAMAKPIASNHNTDSRGKNRRVAAVLKAEVTEQSTF
ncbi:MAG: outer membrane protein OmpA-like peptidoglycan-associated protein [Oceanicoccus sp.]|jgi:outer membrane protein OmpA-like peptidoglycan-associated protein